MRTKHDFDAVQGEITIAALADGFELSEERVDAREGAEFILQARRASRVFVSIMDGDSPVPCGDLRAQEINGGDGRAFQAISTEGRPYLRPSRPGRYSMVVPTVNGYEQHPPVEFHVVDGQDTEVQVHLTPK